MDFSHFLDKIEQIVDERSKVRKIQEIFLKGIKKGAIIRIAPLAQD